MYEYINEHIEDLKKYTQKAFNNSRLSLMKFDKMNVLQVTDAVDVLYKKLKKKSDDFYSALIAYLAECMVFDVDEYKLEEILCLYDPVLLYSFAGECERKRSRYMEALLAIGDTTSPAIMEQQKKAVKLWNQMVEEFAVGVEWMITASEMEKSSVETVQWVTAEDERVCQQCEHLDGLVFPIDKVPNRPHIGCRCKIVKARKQK